MNVMFKGRIPHGDVESLVELLEIDCKTMFDIRALKWPKCSQKKKKKKVDVSPGT